MSIISLSVARQHLRVFDPDDDAMISLYLAAAEQAASDRIGRLVFADAAALELAIAAGAAGEQPLIATPAVVAAVLLILGHLWENREDSVIGIVAADLPSGSKYLLAPYRVGMGV